MFQLAWLSTARVDATEVSWLDSEAFYLKAGDAVAVELLLAPAMQGLFQVRTRHVLAHGTAICSVYIDY